MSNPEVIKTVIHVETLWWACDAVLAAEERAWTGEVLRDLQLAIRCGQVVEEVAEP